MSELKTLYKEAEQLKDEGKSQEAIEKFNAVLEQDPNHVLSHLALAVCYGQVNQHAEAVAHGEKACELEPNDQFNFIALSVTYQKALAATGDMTYKDKAEAAMAHANPGRGMGT